MDCVLKRVLVRMLCAGAVSITAVSITAMSIAAVSIAAVSIAAVSIIVWAAPTQAQEGTAGDVQGPRVVRPQWVDVEALAQTQVPTDHSGAEPVPPKTGWPEIGEGTDTERVPEDFGIGQARIQSGIRYTGARQGDFGITPPDANVAVGRSTSNSVGLLVEAVNGGLMIAQKTVGRGSALFLPFAGSPGALFRSQDAIIFDPKVVYDLHADRFFVVALETIDPVATPEVTQQDRQAYVHLAFSQTQDPRGAWTSYRINVNSWSFGSVDVHADFPSLGFDHEGLYVGLNMLRFPISGQSPIGNKYLLFDKSQLLAGTPSPRHYDELGGAGFPWAMRAVSVLNRGYQRPVAHFVGSYNGPSNFLRLVKIKNPLGPADPNNKFEYDLKVPDYSPPVIDAPQRDACTTLDVLSGQLSRAIWRDGFVVTAHTVTAATDQTSTPRNLVRWYQIRTAEPRASVTWAQLAQWGEVDPGPGRHSFAPAISINEDGGMAVVFTVSSTNEYAGFWASSRTSCDPPGTVSDPTLLRGGDACYSTGGNPSRWGDYQGLVIDPDAGNFWAAGQYPAEVASGNVVWRTHIEQLTVRETCLTCSCETLESGL